MCGGVLFGVAGLFVVRAVSKDPLRVLEGREGPGKRWLRTFSWCVCKRMWRAREAGWALEKFSAHTSVQQALSAPGSLHTQSASFFY